MSLKISRNILGIRKFGIRQGKGFHYYAMEIDLANGLTVKLDASDMKELKDALNDSKSV